MSETTNSGNWDSINAKKVIEYLVNRCQGRNTYWSDIF